MKNIKKMLKTQAKDALPDPAVKERIRTAAGLAPERAEQAAYAHGGTKTLHKKKLLPVLAAALALLIALCILLPLLLSGGGAGGVPVLPPAISAAGDFYAYSASAAGAMLARSGAAANTLRLTDSEKQQIETATEEYLQLVGSLLAEDAITHETTAVPEEYAQYDFAMTITAHGIAGETVNYTMYYSEALTGTETDEGETERTYDIAGVLVLDGTAYPVRGGREFEEESGGGESEQESELWFNAYTGADSYIRIEQEAEQESEGAETETERTHRLLVYQNGRLTESTTIEYETEEGETEIVLTTVRGTEQNTLQFSRDEHSGNNVLFVEAQIGGINAKLRVYLEKSGNRYEFEEDGNSEGGGRG